MGNAGVFTHCKRGKSKFEKLGGEMKRGVGNRERLTDQGPENNMRNVESPTEVSVSEFLTVRLLPFLFVN